MSSSPSGRTRRTFLKQAAAGAVVIAAPAIATAQKSGSTTIVGEGDYRYAVQHDWAQLPDKFTWQTTHNVAVDKAGNVYVIHEGHRDQPEHPAIFVFDAKGAYIKSFGREFQGGGHGLEVREENGQEFLYVTGYQHLKTFAKLDLNGEHVWQHFAPMQSGAYAAGEDTHPEQKWGRDRFMPTNFAFHPSDGGFYLADGYGAYRIHRYDRDGGWLSSFGEPGEANGQFNTPHGLWIDNRGQEPRIVVADRANHRLQWFKLDGQHLKTLDGFLLPANIDTWGDLTLVPDLQARITLLDRNDTVVAHLGEDPDWRAAVLDGMKMRGQPDRWQAGKFIHPHDACFDAEGNIFVAEWVATGRVSKLSRLN
ncbi:MAG: hypothetical protein KDA60_15565 [Planctomycetales bacterium]|nr:hypothetical protein [Planctomycetales bacterium]